MKFKALISFIGAPFGEEIRYEAGQEIPENEAKAMDLANKPELAEVVK